MKAECRAPIMHHQHNVAAETESVEPSIEVGCVIREAVRTGGWGAGFAHADEIRCKATAEIADMRNDVAPKIRPGWVTMEKHDRRSLPRLHVADLGSRNVHPPSRMRVARTDRHGHLLDLQSATALDDISPRPPVREFVNFAQCLFVFAQGPIGRTSASS